MHGRCSPFPRLLAALMAGILLALSPLETNAFSAFKGRFSAQGNDCLYPDQSGQEQVLEDGEKMYADPGNPNLIDFNKSCSCPAEDYKTSINRPAVLACVDGILVTHQAAQCDCVRKSGKYFVERLRSTAIRKRNQRYVGCPAGMILTGCTVACHGNERDVDLSSNGRFCRVDSNTSCTGSRGYLITAICLDVN